MKFTLAIIGIFLGVTGLLAGPAMATQLTAVADLNSIMHAKTDILGEAALKQPDGPSYESFAAQLPPLRYADTDFRHYPITLSAPGATVKARFVSNGSAVNALARQLNWRGEAGVPFEFFVDDKRDAFGADLKR